PSQYRARLESLSANVSPPIEARPEPAPVESEVVTADVDEPRSLGFLRLRRWDSEAGTALQRAVRHLLSHHVDVVYADIDLVAVGEVDEATTALNELGFFLGGLVLHGAEGHDHLRLQLIDFSDIE